MLRPASLVGVRADAWPLVEQARSATTSVDAARDSLAKDEHLHARTNLIAALGPRSTIDAGPRRGFRPPPRPR